MVVWEKYVKKYVWDDDKTPYFIAASDLKRDQADKEIFLYCVFLAIPAIIAVAAFASAVNADGFDHLAPGLYGASILACAASLKFTKSTAAALFAITAPVVLLLHFAINGFAVPDLNYNKAEVVTADTKTDSLTLAGEKRWKTGHGMKLTTTGILPAPLVENETYYLIRQSGTTYQLAASLADAKSGVAMNLTTAGNGSHALRRIIRLHFIEQAGMILFVLLWLRYTLRIVAITKVYPTLPERDMNPWTKLPPGANPPRK